MTIALTQQNLGSIREYISASLAETLQVLFQVDISLVDTVPYPKAENVLMSRIGLEAPHEKFFLYITCAKDILEGIGERLMPDASDTEAAGFHQEIVNEIANVVGNSLKTHLSVNGVEYEIGFPEKVAPKDPSPTGPILHVEFRAEKHRPIDLDIYYHE